jgi:hypothetical protein
MNRAARDGTLNPTLELSGPFLEVIAVTLSAAEPATTPGLSRISALLRRRLGSLRVDRKSRESGPRPHRQRPTNVLCLRGHMK